MSRLTEQTERLDRSSPTPGSDSKLPCFDLVANGYDRRQVDEYIERLERLVARHRAELEEVRVGRLPSDGSRRGPSAVMISAFSGRLKSILESAHDEANEVRKNARSFAKEEEAAGMARIAALQQARDSILGELSGVRTQLDGLLKQASIEPVIGAELA